jgi:sugar/nucleoside kinase (ribokinase family)
MKRVLFIGEINVDLILGGLPSLPVLDREIACSSCELTIGSSTAICACAYASLGGDCSFMGLAGTDPYGDFMVRGMSEFGVRTQWVVRSPDVRTGITVNLIVGKTRSQVTYPGSIAAFSRKHLRLDAIPGFDHVHLGGLYLQEGLLPEVTEILTVARSAGLTASIDPQWDASETWRYMDEWLPLLTWFFPNGDEALSITGARDLPSACEALAGRTPSPLIKHGAEGVWCWIDGRVERIAGYPVDVVDTTGAGDSFDAGYLFAVLEKGMDARSAARFANAAAARSCRFVGGVNARSSYEDVLEFQRRFGQ